MERRTNFGKGDLFYLANICHDCKACYYACPYTEPNELKINIPEVLSELRLESYKEYSTPRRLASFFGRHRRNFLVTALASLLATVLFSLLIGNPQRLFSPHLELGSFYDIFPYVVIIGVGFGIGLYVVANYLFNMIRFYKDIGGKLRQISIGAILRAASDAFLHSGFKGGWHIKGNKSGCYHENQDPSSGFLTLHALIFYGFISAMVSTTLAAMYQDWFGILPPYPVLSLPALFGIAGGICMIVGTLAIIAIRRKEDKRPVFKNMTTLDYAFLLTLASVSITGFLTLILRSTSAMGVVFTIHLGFVLLLFVTAPYGKFVHFTYRYIALIFTRIEEAQQSKLD